MSMLWETLLRVASNVGERKKATEFPQPPFRSRHVASGPVPSSPVPSRRVASSLAPSR